MRTKLNKTGFTLSELLVVLSIMAVLAIVMIPAAKALIRSFETTELINEVIGAALGNASALAMKESKYVGIRFQQDLKGRQYMILIIDNKDETGSPVNGFRAVEGRKPMKLPSSIGVMDLHIVDRGPGAPDPVDTVIDGDTLIGSQSELNDATSFSIVFAPSGKLATRIVQVWNRDKRPATSNTSNDDVFNTLNNVDQNGIGKFVQDDYNYNLGFGFEDSRNSFVIYEKRRLKDVRSDRRWTDYLGDLNTSHVSPFSGKITY